MKHSGLGIASCVLLISAVVLLGFAGVVWSWMGDLRDARHVGVAEGMAFLTLVLLCVMGLAFLSSLLGLGLGLAGLRDRSRIRTAAGWVPAFMPCNYLE